MAAKFGSIIISEVSITISNAGPPLIRSNENISINSVQNKVILKSSNEDIPTNSETKDQKTAKLTIGRESDKGDCIEIYGINLYIPIQIIRGIIILKSVI